MLLDTPICDFGWKAPKFTLDDPDGKSHSFDELMGEKGLLIAFICNHCPYVQTIITRFVADAKTLESLGVGVVAIMSNDYRFYQADSPENMRQFALENSIHFPYLVDEQQTVAKAYGAICTPDFFGLNDTGGLQYRGRLDDAMMNDASNRKAELVEAMKLVAETGNGPKEQKPSMGCSIKWK